MLRVLLGRGAKAIREQSLVVKRRNLEALAELQRECKGRVCTLLQVRAHPTGGCSTTTSKAADERRFEVAATPNT